MNITLWPQAESDRRLCYHRYALRPRFYRYNYVAR